MATSHQSERPIAVYGALAANLAIMVTKFLAAFASGSSAMLSEGIHSLADTGNEGLLLLGIRRAGRPPDSEHPFGHGREIYFWGFIVAILLFGMGGGMSIYEGIVHLRHGEAVKDPFWNYVVLGISFLFEGVSFVIARRQFPVPARRLWRAVQRSKDPSRFVVLVEDFAALAGLAIAAIGLTLSHELGRPEYDAGASLLIGTLLATMALILAYESKELLMGESADPRTVERIRQTALDDGAVRSVEKPLTVHLAPREVVAVLPVRFKPDLRVEDVLAAIDRIDAAVRRDHPSVSRVLIEPRR